jgi:transposase
MQTKQKEKILVKSLRRKGLSYNEIKNQVSVSKSTISRWCQDIKLSPRQSQRLFNNSVRGLEKGRQKIGVIKKIQFRERMKNLGISIPKIQKLYWQEKYNLSQIAKIFNVRRDYIYDLMKRYRIPRRGRSEVNYLTYRYKPRFKVKEKLMPEEEKLKNAGIMLYWAEGAKNGSGINFSNSDPKMIRLFLVFLRRICGINNNRLRVHLYAYSNQNLDKIKNYWQKMTNISLNQFNKPYVRKNNSNKSGRKLPYGLVQIRYNDKKLLETINFWINEYLDSILGRWRSGQSHQTVRNAASRRNSRWKSG